MRNGYFPCDSFALGFPGPRRAPWICTQFPFVGAFPVVCRSFALVAHQIYVTRVLEETCISGIPAILGCHTCNTKVVQVWQPPAESIGFLPEFAREPSKIERILDQGGTPYLENPDFRRSAIPSKKIPGPQEPEIVVFAPKG